MSNEKWRVFWSHCKCGRVLTSIGINGAKEWGNISPLYELPESKEPCDKCKQTDGVEFISNLATVNSLGITQET